MSLCLTQPAIKSLRYALPLPSAYRCIAVTSQAIKPSRVKSGCYGLLVFVAIQPFMYGQARVSVAVVSECGPSK